MLRVKDYKIGWAHVRNSGEQRLTDGKYRHEYQAISVCTIEPQNGSCGISNGYSYCSWSDNFSHEMGRKISLVRAMKTADLSKEERTLIWEAYRNMGMKEGKTRW